MTQAVDFDAIAEAITPNQLATAIGAEKVRDGYRCPQPAHTNADRNPSLSISRREGRTVAFCHGCGLSGSPIEVAAEVWGVSLKDAGARLAGTAGVSAPRQNGLGEPVAVYEYTDEDGGHLFEVCRFEPKTFRQRVRRTGGFTWSLKGVRRVLYRLPRVSAAVKGGKVVVVCEGEKDVLRLEELGLTATTCPAGGGKWRPEYSENLRDALVVIIPDNDDAGREHAETAAQSLDDVAKEVRVIELPGLPPKGDVSDWLDQGGTKKELIRLGIAVPTWVPRATSRPAEPAAAVRREESEHLTDMGNAGRFVRQHGSEIRYVREWDCWLHWDGKRWARDRTGRIKQLAKETVRAMHQEVAAADWSAEARAEFSKHAFRSESEARINAMISLAETEPGIPLVPEDLDTGPWVFNVLNGTIDLLTGQLREHQQGDLITKLAQVEYDLDAKSATFESFLREIMGGREELVRFIQRAVGYSMTGRVSEHVLLFLYGLGANGKSTLLSLLLSLFGDYGRQSEPELLVKKRGDSHPTGVADLKGARLVATTEIDAGRRMAESLVKQLTGGDRIKARYMRQDFFEFEPSHTLWLMANHKPVVKGTDIAIWRRIHLVPFDVTIPAERQDGDLGHKLEGELSGILNWAIQGCLEWQRDGLAPPSEVKAATQGYRADMDTLGDFLGEHCVIEPGAEAEAKTLYERYRGWAEQSGERTVARNVFGRQLKERGFDTQKDPKTRRAVYLGIGLNTGFEATRSKADVPPRKTAHVETNVNVPSGSFATAEAGPELDSLLEVGR